MSFASPLHSVQAVTRRLRRRPVRVTALLAVLAVLASVLAVGSSGPAGAETLKGLDARPAAFSLNAVGAARGSAAGAAQGSGVTAGGRLGSRGDALYGRSRSGLAWHSGFWTGGTASLNRLLQAESWRGRPFDFATVYPDYSTWSSIANSDWSAAVYEGFRGRLSYGLPLLPNNRRGQWSDVTSGAHDAVFRTIARQLVAHGHGDAAVRVGLEANGDWFAWGATASTAPQFKAAFRRVVTVMRAEAPRLTFWFDTAAGFALQGGSKRLDALTLLYPGDAYVDGISMDHYDTKWLPATSAAKWQVALRPDWAPGLADAVAFARARGKGFAVPEWGLHGVDGPGDNPYFVRQMYGFFAANADVLVYECYFNEPDTYIRNALFSPTQLPQSASTYRALF